MNLQFLIICMCLFLGTEDDTSVLKHVCLNIMKMMILSQLWPTLLCYMVYHQTLEPHLGNMKIYLRK